MCFSLSIFLSLPSTLDSKNTVEVSDTERERGAHFHVNSMNGAENKELCQVAEDPQTHRETDRVRERERIKEKKK